VRRALRPSDLRPRPAQRVTGRQQLPGAPRNRWAVGADKPFDPAKVLRKTRGPRSLDSLGYTIKLTARLLEDMGLTTSSVPRLVASFRHGDTGRSTCRDKSRDGTSPGAS
jgi:hypothetical protein